MLLSSQFSATLALSNGQNADLVLGQSSFTSNAASTGQTGMSAPEGLAFDGSGNLWVVEFQNHRILEFSPPFSNGMGAAHVLGQPDFTTGTSNKGSGFTTAGCNVGDHNVNQCGLGNPAGVAFDGSGNLWVADLGNNRVLEFAKGSLTTNGAPATHVIGQNTFTDGTQNKGLGFTTVGCNVGDGTVNQCGLYWPRGLGFDGSGNMWVEEQFNNRVLEFAQGSLTANGPPAALVLGQPTFSTNTDNKGSGFTTGSCNVGDGNINPCGLEAPEAQPASDSHGNLWVPDANGRVLEFMPPFSNGMPASLVLGQSSFTTKTSAITQSGPLGSGVMFDPQGDLWASATNRVLGFSCTATNSCVNGNNAAVVLGQSSFTAGAAATTQSGMNEPAGLAFGSLWVADEGNNRVLEFNVVGPPIPPIPPIPEYPLGLPLLAIFMLVVYGLIRRRSNTPKKT